MKRSIFILLPLLFLAAFLPAEEPVWGWDAGKADAFYSAGDYDAAWLFYERALAGGADDGLVVFRAAESFSRQQMTEDPDFGADLFAVARFFLQGQYPDHPALAEASSRIDDDIVVNRRFIRRVYGSVGGTAPKPRRDARDGVVGAATGFVRTSLEDLGALISLARTDGLREAASCARTRLWSLFLAFLMVNLLTGIILPVVMAVTVAREGRKSYVTAYLFLLHWGPLGIHRFYLGRYVSGIIWLCTAGLAGIGVFFDIFLTGAYVRFWNEDHRGGRPTSSPRQQAGKTKSRKVKTPKPPKAPKAAKTKKTRPPKAAKPPRSKTEKKSQKASTGRVESAAAGAAGASVAASEAFSFNSDSSADDFSMPDSDDAAFGDLPNLDLGGDDFDIPSAGDGDSDGLAAEFPGELSDDDFDLGSLE